MRALLQRVAQAEVRVAGAAVGAVGPGLLALVGFAPDDTEASLAKLLRKLLALRIFPDDAGKMNLALAEAGGGLLIVSQFTLYADCRRGNRPSFTLAAPPAQAQALYDQFVEMARLAHGGPVATGQFGAGMQVHLLNDGPVTIWLDSAEL